MDLFFTVIGLLTGYFFFKPNEQKATLLYSEHDSICIKLYHFNSMNSDTGRKLDHKAEATVCELKITTFCLLPILIMIEVFKSQIVISHLELKITGIFSASFFLSSIFYCDNEIPPLVNVYLVLGLAVVVVADLILLILLILVAVVLILLIFVNGVFVIVFLSLLILFIFLMLPLL